MAERFNDNRYNPQELIKGLQETAVPLNQSGIEFTERTSSLQSKAEDMIANTWGIQEIDHLYILPIFDKNGDLVDMLARVYFNTKDVQDGDIVRVGYGKPSNNGKPNVLDYVGGGTTSSGDFRTSDKFKRTFAALALSDDDRLHVKSIKENPYVAVLDLDINALMQTILQIDANAPYNFKFLGAARLGGEDYNVLISKHIDLGSGKRGRHRGNRMNYAELDRAFAKQNSKYGNGGDGRRF